MEKASEGVNGSGSCCYTGQAYGDMMSAELRRDDMGAI